MRFLTKRVLDPNVIHSNPGSRTKPMYSPFYDGKKFSLVESGSVDVQDAINSHAMECDINFILSRLSRGDMSVLNNNSPIYADFKNLPSNFREVFDIAFNAERIFNSLSPDVRKQFDNDYRQFIYAAGTPEFNSIMGITPDPVPDPVPVIPVVPSDPVVV